MMQKRRVTTSYYNCYYEFYKPFMTTVVSGLSSNIHDFNDYMSIARQELLYVMKHFDPQLGSFKAYFRSRIWGQIKHDQHRQNKHKVIELDIDNPIMDSYVGTEGRSLIVEEMLECLDDRQKRVVTDYYLNNMTIREIHAATGISVTTIYNVRNKALEKMRHCL